MSWNHKDRLFAMSVGIQPVAGTFADPGTAGLVGVGSPTIDLGTLNAPDPTQTGAVWEAPDIFLGRTGGGGGTIPLRGPGGAAPFAANGWPVGLILQAAGFAELIDSAGQAATAVGGAGSTSSIKLDAAESSVDDFFIGAPVQHANIGTGFRATTLIRDYVGATKMALLAETLGAAPNAGNYTRPKSVVYLLGALTTAPPNLSISIWRDRRRYDFKDCVITAVSFDIPVSNEANQSFPSIQFSFKGTYVPNNSVVTTPTLPTTITGVPVRPARGGKFYLDGVKLGHASVKLDLALTAGAASNQNQDAGQDGYDILSGTRTFNIDLNQMDVADFDVDARVDAQTLVPALSTWGGGAGNCLGLMIANNRLNPLTPGSRNGYVNLSGTAAVIDPDKSLAFTVWGW